MRSLDGEDKMFVFAVEPKCEDVFLRHKSELTPPSEVNRSPYLAECSRCRNRSGQAVVQCSFRCCGKPSPISSHSAPLNDREVRHPSAVNSTAISRSPQPHYVMRLHSPAPREWGPNSADQFVNGTRILPSHHLRRWELLPENHGNTQHEPTG